MPIRAVVFFNLGPPFGGFRAAARPGLAFGLDHPVAFQELERALEAAEALLSSLPFEQWATLTEAQIAALVPRCDGRVGAIDFAGEALKDGVGELVARAILPFRHWPFGGWALYEGWHCDIDGGWARFSEEQARQLW